MRRYLWMIGLLLTALATSGCGPRSNVAAMFSEDRLYEKSLQYTRGAQIVRELETKAAITATLLNEVFPDRYRYDEGVYFFVGIVTEMDVKKFKKSYHLRLLAQNPLDEKLRDAIKERRQKRKEIMRRAKKEGLSDEETKKLTEPYEEKGFDPVKIEPLDSNSELYQLMPNVNRWGRYFLVKFSPVKDKRLTLEFGLYPYDPVKLTFVKASPRR